MPKPYPERVVQFGGGNFLRAFVDWVIETLNEETDFGGRVVVVKPTPQGSYATLDAQGGQFHVQLHGFKNGHPFRELMRIQCISRTLNPYADYPAFLSLAEQAELRFIVSNTTEAGIVFAPQDKLSDTPPGSFPAKLTAFLYRRFQHFAGDRTKGFIILPCELVEQNGTTLQNMVLRYADHWNLGAGFADWVQAGNIFCNTLVDRIVTGAPKEPLLLSDPLLVEGEYYHSWLIQGAIQKEFPVGQTNLNVKFVADLQPYRNLKVRVLNGAHTAMVPLGCLLGLNAVHEVMSHPPTRQFIEALLWQEVLPVLDFPQEEARQFIQAVLNRFQNPYLHHRLQDIALNSLSKFKVRLLPTLLDYTHQQQELPPHLVFAFAALIRFYAGDGLNDDPDLIQWFKQVWAGGAIAEVVDAVLANEALWGVDLRGVDGLAEQLRDYLQQIEDDSLGNMLTAILG